MGAAELRQVECIWGPQDGACLTVATTVRLPETISFPADSLGLKRHIYRRVEESAGYSAYRYESVRVGA